MLGSLETERGAWMGGYLYGERPVGGQTALGMDEVFVRRAAG